MSEALFDAVASSLAGADVESRRAGARALGSLTGPRAAELAAVALADLDWRVRRDALEASLAFEEPARTALADRCLDAARQGENVGLRNAAIEVLSRLGELGVRTLRRGLGEPSDGRQKFLLEALGECGDPRVVPDVAAQLEDADANVVAAAIDALGRLGGQEASLALRRKLPATEAFQRAAALEALARAGTRVPLHELMPHLEDRFAFRAALPLLGRCAELEAVGPLLHALARPRSAAAASEALVRLGRDIGAEPLHAALVTAPDEVCDNLRTLLEGEDGAVRRAAAELAALAQDPQALAALATLGASGQLTPPALRALERWGADAAPAMLAASRSLRGEAAAVALQLAAELASAGDLAHPVVAELRAGLLAMLGDEAERARAAARGLRRLATGEDAEALAASAVTGPAAEEAAEALLALAERAPQAVDHALAAVRLEDAEATGLPRVFVRARGAAALGALRSGASSARPAVRRASVQGLGELGSTAAAEVIALALTDEDLDVRVAAARELGRVAVAPAGTEALLRTLASDSPMVQAAAAEALGRRGDHQARDALVSVASAGRPSVAPAALEALASLGEAGLPQLLDAALARTEDGALRGRLAALTKVLPRDAAQERQRRLLGDPAWPVRLAAAQALAARATRGDAGAKELAASQLPAESDPMVRAALLAASDEAGT